METISIANLRGSQSAIPITELDTLSSRLRGTLIRAEDISFDEARRLWNGMFDKRPAVILRCTGVADVIDAVRFARERNLLVAIRGGAHNVAGLASYDGGFVIDLSQMRAVHVDPNSRTVRVEAGAQLGDIDRETQAFGLVVPTGVVSETGIAGLTLNGGVGWLRRKWGMTCDNLVSVELVTAEGQWIKASKTEHSDLFWALRGGGGNFGVVTNFEFELQPLGPEVMFCFVMYPDHKDILQKFSQFAQNEPEEVGMLSFTGTVPADESFPEVWWYKPFFVVAACYAGSAEDGERVLQPLREWGTPIIDFSDRMPYTEVQKFLDADYPKGRHYYWKSVYLKEFTDETIDTLLTLNRQAPSHHSTIDIWTMGGAMNRVSSDESPLSPRETPFMIGIEANWDEAKENDHNIAWVRDCVEGLAPFAAPGIYLNFPGFMEDADQLVKTAYGNNFQRLVKVKQQYDPDNFFRLNQNINPQAV
ncbi:FAD-binding oxidoreductase [Acaryochloris marina NIES-2412]|uniref:FAD-binding oxidoreductase n=1 Tax=Acaryochloris marina TaxID=155978 RepID=UPI0040596582